MRAHFDIYVPRAFQWYEELFNPMSFDPYNHPLEIRKSIGTPIPKVGAHLGVWGSFLQLSCTSGSMKCDSRVHSWLAPSQALALVTSPRLGLWQKTSTIISIPCPTILNDIFFSEINTCQKNGNFMFTQVSTQHPFTCVISIFGDRKWDLYMPYSDVVGFVLSMHG